ncbi:hypothetical protein Tco_1122398 [Tanacetum coccineum]|uniref:Uncharacterized protein n=1 Tax=Tanacetum coccineum TaxID=301880 RepID=A0ABQ5J312_9ASTR
MGTDPTIGLQREKEVYSIFPNQNDTLHERPGRKIRLYTRFFNYANFRLPLSTFLVDVLRHFRINISQLSMIGAAKNEDEPLFLATTIRRIVLLLLVASDRAESELEVSVDRLFDECGSGNQADEGDSMGVGEGANIQPIVKASHPPKKLREDHGTPGGTSVGGKSHFTIKRLLVRAVLNADVGVAVIPTLPFVTAFVSSTPEHEAEDHTDSVAKPNLVTIGASQRFVISLDSSHHSGPTIAEAEVDSLSRSSVPIMTTVTTVTSTVDPALVAKVKFIKPSLFSVDSSSGGRANPHTGVF